jgi:hypothetical protein
LFVTALVIKTTRRGDHLAQDMGAEIFTHVLPVLAPLAGKNLRGYLFTLAYRNPNVSISLMN